MTFVYVQSIVLQLLNRTWASHDLWFQVQHYPFWTNLTHATLEIFKLLFMHHLIFGLKVIQLESIEHGYIRSLKSQSYKQMST